MKITDKITDKQIRTLHAAGLIDDGTYRGALLVPSHHGSLGRRVRRECRAHCAEVFSQQGHAP